MAKLAFSRLKDWRFRWVVSPGSKVLHRVKIIEDRREWRDIPQGHGETVCGRTTLLWMPGFLDRLHAKRCVKCCRGVGIQPGWGAPYNDPSCFPPEGREVVSSQHKGDEP